MRTYIGTFNIILVVSIVVSMLIFAGTSSAKTFKKCTYIAQYQDGRYAGVTKSGKALKGSKACAEAKKRCNKKLKKLYKKGKLERGAVCYKYGGEVKQ